MRKTVLALAAVAALAAAGQAAAHARLITGSPKNGATVAAPKALTLHYSEELVPAASSVKVPTNIASPRSTTRSSSDSSS